MVARGDVWWGEAPEYGRRPYLVLTRNEAIGVLNKVLVAPLTTTARGIPTEVSLEASEGLPKACAVNLDNLLMVPTGVLTERLASLDLTRMHAVCRALNVAAGC